MKTGGTHLASKKFEYSEKNERKLNQSRRQEQGEPSDLDLEIRNQKMIKRNERKIKSKQEVGVGEPSDLELEIRT